ncbi:hypothetical protein RB195_007135 [Necator americanus]|uniref:C2H2-type domain-containing protein n=1 Tax=Necator americanus TaxID=51031 RepID=A0ABR1BVT7_NECAM
MDATRNIVMNVCSVCDVDKGKKIQRQLAEVHGYSQEQVAEFKAEKKNRKFAASGRSVYNCEYCDAGFNNISGLSRHRTTKHADEYSPPTILCSICRETVKVSHIDEPQLSRWFCTSYNCRSHLY